MTLGYKMKSTEDHTRGAARPRRMLGGVLGYIFDIRFLGVLGQILFILLAVLAVRTIGGNFSENIHKLGESQFLCQDGSFSYRCAYDFMSSEAGFDISDSVIEFKSTDSYWKAFYVGILNTLKVTALGVVLMTILGTLVGIARLSNNWLINKTALWYVELMRNTPILIQLFFIYFGVILTLPNIDNPAQFFSLPIYLSNRGMNFPALEFTATAPVLIAAVIIGLFLFVAIAKILRHRQEQTGRKTYPIRYGFLAFFVLACLGWYASTSGPDHQGFLIAQDANVSDLEGLARVVRSPPGKVGLTEGEISLIQQQEKANLGVCVVRGSTAATNISGHLEDLGIPHKVLPSYQLSQARKKYDAGDCMILAAPKADLVDMLADLKDPAAHTIASVAEGPVLISVPTRQGFNYTGGAKMQPEFIALLIGLVLYNSAKLAEVVRAGILSVSRGQSEAAISLGYSESQRLRLIVLPQSLPVIIPPTIGYYLTLAKDTSLGIAVGFPDMYLVANTSMNQSGRVLQIFILMMLVYMTISLTFSVVINWYNSRIKRKER
jgi:general L-amino acid transport system permease protein